MDQLKKIILECFPDLDVENSSLELGCCDAWDSLGNFNLLLTVEEEFGTQFSPEQMLNLKSYESIKALLENK